MIPISFPQAGFDPAFAWTEVGSPDIVAACLDGIWIKQLALDKVGYSCMQHRHAHDHLTLLATGRVRVSVDGRSSDFDAPHIIVVRAGHHHAFMALSDCVVLYCVHRLEGDALEPEYLAPDMEVAPRVFLKD